MKRAIAELERQALASGRAFEPITVDVNSAGTVANITIPIAGNGTDAASNASFRMLRSEVVPETVGALPDTQAGVTGQTAEWRDQADALKSNLAPVVAFVLLFAFSLMLVAFRSIVVAIKAILLNLLSVAAAYGVLVLVFQHGVGKGLLDVSSAAGIDAVVPLLLFVILFGLSMDYHVFILSRIRETFDRGKSMDEAISHGIKSTAGVVTSAAIVMVAVFAIFATLSWPFFKQFGVGLAAAILIDATIVRGVLLPASMKLLGEWNWYLPSWLQWLPAPRPLRARAHPRAPTRGQAGPRPRDGPKMTIPGTSLTFRRRFTHGGHQRSPTRIRGTRRRLLRPRTTRGVVRQASASRLCARRSTDRVRRARRRVPPLRAMRRRACGRYYAGGTRPSSS